jgi:Protein of unknown function (DUF3016)
LVGASVVILGCAVIGPARAAGKIEVVYVDEDSFSDLGGSVNDRQQALRTLSEHFKKMAERLPDEQGLRLEITDIDLAGTLNPTLGVNVRQYTGAGDRPQIKLRFALWSGEKMLKLGEANIFNVNYFQNRRTYYQGKSELPHERRMLDEWFDANILAR